MIIAIIPAKAYSEGLPGKNVAEINGKTLINRAIESADIPEIDKIFVTTDIIVPFWHTLEMANEHKVEILDRPPCLALDNVQVDEVILFAFRQIQERYPDWEVDAVVVLQPTSPFRNRHIVQEAVNMYLDMNQNVHSDNPDFVVPDILLDPAYTIVSVYDAPGYTYIEKSGMITPINHDPEKRLGRQQVLDNMDGVVVENGAVYVVDADRLSKERSFRLQPMMPFYMSWENSIEIDDQFNWDLALFINKWGEFDEDNS
jgi:CMP-N-acetylneuraminic acid synthetase